ncbi:hypothetical protein L210DRAFT_3527503 [Boletus edulis BED1]|uniref:Uncharacterized protein n=1 Tax=Boletus edulis BED1 TaxID=1328754 RepID=A0AAD4C565_BOLED|nr:hypothetical protein L210DRAFT_3527503 [Boletus edulis BED1]
MVKLSLISPKGNQGVRYFPYQGYLGLTPLRFEGLVRTQIEQDGKPILAKDIIVAVRCYESRHGRLGTVQTNILYQYSVTLWQKQDTQEWSEVGDTEHPFRFSVPSHVATPSTALYFQEYRIFWRIEAVLNHIPISAVGCRQVRHFELPLIRYDAPASLSPPTPLTPSSPSYMTLLRSKSRGPSLRYCVLVSPNPIGPLDIVSIQLIVQPPDSSVSIRSASAFVERRIHFSDLRVSPPESSPGAHRFSSYPPPVTQGDADHVQESGSPTYPGSSFSSSQDLLHPASSSSVYSGDSLRPLLQHNDHSTDESVPLPSGSRGATHILAHAESAGRFSRDSSGVWRHKLTFSWPDTKSSSRWAVGESVQTGLASVKFFLRVKLIVSSLANSAETIELEDKELVIVSTNDLQRQLALSRYSDWVNTPSGRSKSKSPRRVKRERHTEQLPSPPSSPRQLPVSDEPDTLTIPPFPPAHSHKISTASSPYPGRNSSMSKVSRRPHTSAGPRDWPSRLDTPTYEGSQNYANRLAVPPRPETAHPTRFPKSPTSRGFFRQRSVEAPRPGSGSSGGHLSAESSQHHSHGSLLFERVNLVDVQAWEQELARIESASQRNSADMLGIVSQRKKASVEQSSILTYLRAEG